MRDEMNTYEKKMFTQVARLDLPMRSVVNLRRVASELRGLAEILDRLSRDPDDPFNVLFEATRAARHTNKNLRKIRTPGRPKKRVENLRW